VAAGEIANGVSSDAPNYYRVEAIAGAHISMTGGFRDSPPRFERGGTTISERGKRAKEMGARGNLRTQDLPRDSINNGDFQCSQSFERGSSAFWKIMR
jgi:hypothetical protein